MRIKLSSTEDLLVGLRHSTMFNVPKAVERYVPHRDCVECGKKRLFVSEISLEEWRKGPDASVCNKCIISAATKLTERQNRATAAEYYDDDLEKPFAKGAFRYVAKGVYSEGERKGQPCVCKWFKNNKLESSYLEAEIETAKEAIRIVSDWNATKFVDRVVRVNLPEIWTFDSNDGGKGWAGRTVFQEPFIENYEKFNSNTGWANNGSHWARVMQAISHFSYHASKGQHLLCDLQGAVYSDGVVLTDPAILSCDQRYGPTDLGEKGIISFFEEHVCNEFCRSGWLRPSDQISSYAPRRGSTMEHVETQKSRPKLSRNAPEKKRRKIADEEEEWKEGDE